MHRPRFRIFYIYFYTNLLNKKTKLITRLILPFRIESRVHQYRILPDSDGKLSVQVRNLRL